MATLGIFVFGFGAGWLVRSLPTQQSDGERASAEAEAFLRQVTQRKFPEACFSVISGGELNPCMDRLAALDLSALSGLPPNLRVRELRVEEIGGGETRAFAQARDVTPQPAGDFSLGLVLGGKDGWRVSTYDEHLLADR